MKKSFIILTAALTSISLFSCGAVNSSDSEKKAATTESSSVLSLPTIDKAEIVAEYTDEGDGYEYRLDVEGDLKYWAADITITECGEQSTFQSTTRDYDRNSRIITAGSDITAVSAVITPYDADNNAGKPVTINWDPNRVEKASSEKGTEKATSATTSVAIEDITLDGIAGNWIYELRDASSTEEYVGIPKGYVTVSSDGTYTYNNGAFTENGTVKVDYDEFMEGNKVPFYAFYNENNEFWIGCYVNQNEKDIFYIGNGGESRLVRDTGNAVGGTDNYSVPNEYGFYEYKEPPREGAGCIMVKDIEGKWIHGQFILEIKSCDMYSGEFEDSNEGGNYTGKVKLEFTLEENNMTQLWYNLYTNDGKLFKSFKATGDIPVNSIKDEQSNGIEHTRVKTEN
ncbi:MAG: hypothetical protein IKO47_13010 [Ruminococcus sp.]|nr:hypothetical protein [Ruminococcus sp.]